MRRVSQICDSSTNRSVFPGLTAAAIRDIVPSSRSPLFEVQVLSLADTGKFSRRYRAAWN
jgi:hypothetical protein